VNSLAACHFLQIENLKVISKIRIVRLFTGVKENDDSASGGADGKVVVDVAG
jgi:hypothetical protein